MATSIHIPSKNAKIWQDPTGILSGAITGTAGDDIYRSQFEQNLEILDNSGNNYVYVDNTRGDYGYGFAISQSKLVFAGTGFTGIYVNKANSGYYGFHVNGEITIGDGGSEIIVNLTGNLTYQNNILNVAKIFTGNGSDDLLIALATSGFNDIIQGMAEGSISLGGGDDSLTFDLENDNPIARITATVRGSIDLGEGSDKLVVNSPKNGIDGTQVQLGSGNDELLINCGYSAIANASIQAGAGDDKIIVSGTLSNQYAVVESLIDTGSGNDYVSITTARNSTLDMGSGFDTLELAGNMSDYTINKNSDRGYLLKKNGDSFFSLTINDAEKILFNNARGAEALSLLNVNNVVRGNSLYTIVDGPSWTQAEANSVKLGGHLVTLNNNDEDIWLSLNLYGSQYFIAGGIASPTNLIQSYFIGVNDRDAEGIYKWSSSEALAYVATLDPSNPNNDFADFYVVNSNADGKSGHWINVDNDASYYRDGNSPGVSKIVKGIAETRFIRRGDSAYVIVQGPTWEEAEANAVKLGGHLVTINDAEENSFLVDFLNKETDLSFYIGATDKEQDGVWKDPTGNLLTYTNWHTWQGGGEPNNNNGGEDFGVIYSGNYAGTSTYRGKWNDISFIQEVTKGIAEIKLAPNNKPTGSPTLSGTTKVGQVITIDHSPIQDADNFTGYTPTYNYSFEVSNDNGSTWSKLTSPDATDNNSTYTLTTPEVGKQVRGVVSYLDGYGTNESVASLGSSVTSAAVVRGNSIYTIFDAPHSGNQTTFYLTPDSQKVASDWYGNAEQQAVKLGGHLVTVNNLRELDFLKLSFADAAYAKGKGTPWVVIGMRDSGAGTPFVWTSGDTVDLSQFENHIIFPSDEKLDHYAIVYLKDGQDATAGYWGQVGAKSAVLPESGISETPFIRRGDSAYVIVQGPTWEEAEANAVKLGGHLVTINDAEENEWILDLLNPTIGYWVGLTDKDTEGVWKWSSGESVSFYNWYPGEPSNSLTSSEGEDYVGLASSPNPNGDAGPVLAGQWGDLNNAGVGGVPNMFGIAEIKLAPNSTPTGTPTLSGTFKAGQVITIDRTPIQDADNFNGYTPTYKYSWEVAKDPGMTMMIPVWESLNTADATDGNETFTITADLTGKLIRGVVSYLDGYGTNEVVPSTASAPITTSAPPVQSLTLNPPSKTAIRSGVSTTSAIAYNVSTGEIALTGIGASLYFDSTQLTVNTAGDPFKGGLLGSAITADITNVDGDPKTDKILALTYADFGGNFPGSGNTLPLTLANLNLVPTASYTGTTLHLKGSPATGYTATGADLALGYNASPVVKSSLSPLTTNRGSAFSYTVPSTLFSDSDSTLSFSATTAAGASLPSWLSFNAVTRTLSGTPATGGTLNLNLSASDELGSVSTPLSIKVREVQQLFSSTAPIRYQRNKELTVPINYSTTDGSSSTGLAFKVHYDSSLFSFDSATGVTNKSQADLFQVGAVQLDTADSDNDPSTDRYIPITIASFSGQFPSGVAPPTKLADLTFKAIDKTIDPITGLRDTSINFTEIEAGMGYGFSSTSASLKPLSFSLDVDRDGKVTALGDGLMVIRYLFGTAFSGDALINKAISPDSPLLGVITYASMSAQQKADVASQVAANIQQGVDSKLLDVDKDNRVTALGDGLMVIRRLFGTAFDGAALTSKAISPDSPYFGQSNDYQSVAFNIDSLRSSFL